MDYALSRLQARFGERPDEALWQKLEAAPEHAAALEIARSCGLRRWVAGIAAHAERHAIEIALRARWRECVTEIGAWMPGCWLPALLWTRALVDLPALGHLVRDSTPLPWMLDDPVLQVYARADAPARAAMLRAQGLALLEPALEAAQRAALPAGLSTTQICTAWLREWRRRWPRWADTAALEQLARLIDAAMSQPAATGRPELLRRLRSLFRRSVLSPVLVFIYIAFAALDIERLRAALLRHDLAREGIIAS